MGQRAASAWPPGELMQYSIKDSYTCTFWERKVFGKLNFPLLLLLLLLLLSFPLTLTHSPAHLIIASGKLVQAAELGHLLVARGS